MTHINQRRDYATNWTTANPVLQLGEVGWEQDTLKAKLGDGVTAWNELEYAVRGTSEVLSVAGRTGDVVLTKSDVGLSNVNNTSDMNKPVSTAQAAFSRATVTGKVTNLGNRTGNLPLATFLQPNDAINGVVRMTMTGDVTLTAANMPDVAAGTQFVMIVSQDSTGSRYLTLTDIRKPGGLLGISTAPNLVDILVFFYDGLNWYASVSGLGYAT